MSLIRKAKNKIIRSVRESFQTVSYSLSGRIPEKIKQAKGLRILIYHGICKNKPHLFNARFLSENQFEAHLIAIKKCYNPVSWADVNSGKFSGSRLNVLITFDDGLKNNYELALPLLQKHNIPAVFFISAVKDRSAYLFNDVMDVFPALGPEKTTIKGTVFERKKLWLNYRYISATGDTMASFFHGLNAAERTIVLEQVFSCVPKENFSAHAAYLDLISENELRQMASQEHITIGSHGLMHTDLSLLSAEELSTELLQSKQLLEAITGKPCTTIAFPYGAYNPAVIDLCRNYGYTGLFGSEKINASDKTIIIERFTVNPYVSAISQMYYIAAGNYD